MFCSGPTVLAETLVQEYGIDLRRARADVTDLLTGLHTGGLTVQVKDR